MVEKTVWPILMVLLLGLTACQTIATEPSTDYEVAARHEPDDVASEEIDSQPIDSTQVVKRLQREALILQSEGRWAEAELKLERALRIDSQQGEIYEQLATVRMGQSRFSEAEQIALKGLSVANLADAQKGALWHVIAQCRSAQGDISGARAAREEMAKWE